VRRQSIGLGKDRHRANAAFSSGSDDSNCDLTAVRDE
jgi:hypothetical protein